MNRSFPLACLIYASAFSASAAEQQLAFPVSSPLQVVALSSNGNPNRWSMAPSDPRYAKLKEWLAQNQSGWSPYLATAPGRGIFVSAGNLRIQFTGTSALACRDNEPCVEKKVSEAEYGFLVK